MIVPRPTLIRHFSRTLLARTALSGGILLGLMEILSLLEQTNPILERHLGLRGILTYALLHLPQLAANALPLSVMLGALFTLTQMSLGSEIASFRAAGLSTPGMIRLMLPATIAIGLGGIVLEDQIAPRSETALTRWWNRTDPAACATPHDFWFHDGPRLVHAHGFANGGKTLCTVTLYARAPDGILQDMQTTPEATYTHNAWHAVRSRQLTLNADRTTIRSTDDTATPLPITATPTDILRLSQPYPALSANQIRKALNQAIPTALPTAEYRMILLSRLMLPIILSVMLLLALPVVYIPPRTGTRSPLPVYCLGGGFAFVIVQGLFQALGNAGTLPAPLAILAAPLIVSLLASAVLVRMED